MSDTEPAAARRGSAPARLGVVGGLLPRAPAPRSAGADCGAARRRPRGSLVARHAPAHRRDAGGARPPAPRYRIGCTRRARGRAPGAGDHARSAGPARAAGRATGRMAEPAARARSALPGPLAQPRRVAARRDRAGATIASQQLQLARNVRAALLALQLAEGRLARADRPQFAPIRRALARDIERLKAAPAIDFPALALRLDNLIASVDSLPLAFDERIERTT